MILINGTTIHRFLILLLDRVPQCPIVVADRDLYFFFPSFWFFFYFFIVYQSSEIDSVCGTAAIRIEPNAIWSKGLSRVHGETDIDKMFEIMSVVPSGYTNKLFSFLSL